MSVEPSVWVIKTPGASLSATSTRTLSTAIPLKLPSLLATVAVIADTWKPSTAASSMAAMVTDCATFQLLELKFSTVVPEPLAVIWPSPLKDTATLDVGALVRVTSKLSVVPPSITLVEPRDSVMTTPAASLSMTLTKTLEMAMAS